MKQYSTIRVDKPTHDMIQKVALIKHWSISELLRVFASLFSCGMELVNDESISMEILRENYQYFQLSIIQDGRTLMRPQIKKDGKKNV